MSKEFFKDKRPHKGLDVNKFISELEEYLTINNQSNLNEAEQSLYEYRRMNLARMKRIAKSYSPSEELVRLISDIRNPQIWMILTEDWCGDSAQTLPYIAKLAEINRNITLRLLKRDDNTDIMDQYLHNGKSRSIPKLVAFDMNGNELFQWGPRPKLLAELVSEWKKVTPEKKDLLEKIHLWYGRDRGKELEKEFISIIGEL